MPRGSPWRGRGARQERGQRDQERESGGEVFPAPGSYPEGAAASRLSPPCGLYPGTGPAGGGVRGVSFR